MGLVPRLVELLAAVRQPSTAPPGGAAGCEAALRAAMDPTRTIGPLLCLLHLARLQVPQCLLRIGIAPLC